MSPSGSTRLPQQGSLHGNASLVTTVAMTLVLLVLPLPSLVLDVAWAALLAASLLVVLASLRVRQQHYAARFPGLLLSLTLLRLILCIATVRMLLTQSATPDLVRSLGVLMAGDSPWIAVVLLLSLVIAQLIVVVRGNERIAEIRARFALDALPGKQLSIDADLRGGAIHGFEAQRQRRAVGAEGELFGALDGTMKFVRGEQIAVLVIVVLGVMAATYLGVSSHQQSVAQALRRATLASVGIGLVAQLSAFALALATGLQMTQLGGVELRAYDTAPSTLGVTWRVLSVCAVVFGLLAIVPGAPWITLLCLSLALLLSAWWHKQKAASLPKVEALRVHPWTVSVSSDLAHLLSPQRPQLEHTAEQLRSDLKRQLGVAVSPCVVGVDPALPRRHCMLSVRNLPALSLVLPEALETSQVPGRIAEQFRPVLFRHAADFIGIGETQTLLADLDPEGNAAALQVVPKLLSVSALCEVLRRLVSEQVNIGDLKAILEALAVLAQSETDSAALVEQVRQLLKRTITHQYAQGRSHIEVLVIDFEVARLLQSSVTRVKGVAVLGISPAAARDFLAATKRALLEAVQVASDAKPVIIASSEVRRFVRGLLEVDLPDLPVLSPGELLPQIELRQLGTISLKSL